MYKLARYNVLKDGDPILRKIAKPVSDVNDNIKKLMKNMYETMKYENGVGLAAPQIGISKRVIVVDIGDGAIYLANPEIIHSSGVQKGPEGCLSIPNTNGNVVRFEEIKVVGLDENNRKIEIHAEGFKSRALQHEIDHLNGILFTDKATQVMRDE